MRHRSDRHRGGGGPSEHDSALRHELALCCMGTGESTAEADMDGHRLDNRVVALLHDAAFDDARWPEASAQIDKACEIKGNMLVCGAGTSHEDVVIYLSRLLYRGERNEALERKYFEEYYASDERVPRFRTLPDSRLVHVSELYTDEEKKTSATYNEALPLSDTQNCLSVRMNALHGSCIVRSFADPVQGQGWSFHRTENIERLLPHLRHYVQVRQALAHANGVATTMGALLESADCGVIELDPSGQIVGMNARAEAVLRTGDGLTGAGKRLRARLPGEDARLQRLLARALPRFGGAGGSMIVSHPVDSPPKLVLHVTPASTGEAGVQPNRLGAIVLLVQPQRRVAANRELVAHALGLTGAETEVAVMLAEGHTLRDIATATATGRSPHTVRWHLYQIFARNRISRQVEHVQLIRSLGVLERGQH